MSTETPSPSIASVDPYKHLKITLNPNGSLTHNFNQFPDAPVAPDPSHPNTVLSKEIPINPSKGTGIRLFLPRCALDSPSSLRSKKLPLVVYFHGGGFIRCSPRNNLLHEFCLDITGELPAVVASVGYRLAPEHRLPAAYDDAVEALHIIAASSDGWLGQCADLNTCYLIGSSAGAKGAYHVGLRLAESHDSLAPLSIRGLILHQTFLGGTKRTESELREVNDPMLPLGVTDLMWKLALPAGANRDHEYCNLTVNGGSKVLDKIWTLGWRYPVTGCHGDPLVDRQAARLLEKKGLTVESHFDDGGGFHGVEYFYIFRKKTLFFLVKNFVSTVSN